MKIWMLMQENSTKEIAWHGLVRKEGNDYTIYDILMFPQTVTAATVTTDDTLYSTWLTQLPDEQFDHLRFHGHSHVRMGITPSGTDLTYQHHLIRDVKDYYIFGIFNLNYDVNLCLYDVVNNVLFESADITLKDFTLMVRHWAKTNMEEHLHKPVTTATVTAASTQATSQATTPRQTGAQTQGYSYDQAKGYEYNQAYWENYYQGRGY